MYDTDLLHLHKTMHVKRDVGESAWGDVLLHLHATRPAKRGVEEWVCDKGLPHLHTPDT